MSREAVKWATGQDLKGPMRWTLLCLAQHAEKGSGLSWPANATIARYVGIDRRSVLRILARLQFRRLIIDSGHREGKTRQIKVWRLPCDQGQLNLGKVKPRKGDRESPLKSDTQSHPFNGSKGGLPVTCDRESHVTPLSPAKGDSIESYGKVRKEEKNKSDGPNSPAADCALIFAAWNQMAKSAKLPIASTLTEARRRNLKARIKEHGRETIITAIATVPRSQFLTGHNDRQWRAHFDWLLQPSSMTKLVEGAYAGATSPDDMPFTRAIREGRA